MSYLLDDNDKIMTNYTIEDGKQHIENIRHANQG